MSADCARAWNDGESVCRGVHRGIRIHSLHFLHVLCCFPRRSPLPSRSFPHSCLPLTSTCVSRDWVGIQIVRAHAQRGIRPCLGVRLLLLVLLGLVLLVVLVALALALA